MGNEENLQELALSISEESKLNRNGFKFLKQLGEGSYAKVYLAEFSSRHVKEKFACKVINKKNAPKIYLEKFLPREFEIMTKLNHKHIIYTHSIYNYHLNFFIFMRYAENGDLFRYIKTHGGLSEGHAKLWFRQICFGLQYMHHLNIAHRDLKCENLLISQNFNIKIADFGFARSVLDTDRRALLSETYCGSLLYAAPEVINSTPYYPKIADMWSLGVILYVMTNDSMPFNDKNIKKLLECQVNRLWKIRSKFEDILSEELKSLLLMLLEPDIATRFDIDEVLLSSWIVKSDNTRKSQNS